MPERQTGALLLHLQLRLSLDSEDIVILWDRYFGWICNFHPLSCFLREKRTPFYLKY